jgi:hypothetical protein
MTTWKENEVEEGFFPLREATARQARNLLFAIIQKKDIFLGREPPSE